MGQDNFKWDEQKVNELLYHLTGKTKWVHSQMCEWKDEFKKSKELLQVPVDNIYTISKGDTFKGEKVVYIGMENNKLIFHTNKTNPSSTYTEQGSVSDENSIYTPKQLAYVSSIPDNQVRQHLLHQIRLRDIMEADRDAFEKQLSQERINVEKAFNAAREIPDKFPSEYTGQHYENTRTRFLNIAKYPTYKDWQNSQLNIKVPSDFKEVFEKYGDKPLSTDTPVDWEQEMKKCKDNPYYFATKYLIVNGKPFTTYMGEDRFNQEFAKMHDTAVPIQTPLSTPTTDKHGDWKILQYKCANFIFTLIGGKYVFADFVLPIDAKKTIHSVLRKSDNKVFTVGDKVSVFTDDGKGFDDTIHHFTFTGGVSIIDVYFENQSSGFGIHWLRIAKILSQPSPYTDTPVLLKTEDGYEYKGEQLQLFYIEKDKWQVTPILSVNFWLHENTTDGVAANPYQNKWFKEKANAENWILENKPMLSINDFFDATNGQDIETVKRSPFYRMILEIAKQKLNNPNL